MNVHIFWGVFHFPVHLVGSVCQMMMFGLEVQLPAAVLPLRWYGNQEQINIVSV